MKKLIIFDLDDTLVDTWGAVSLGCVKRAVEEMFKNGLITKSFDYAIERLTKINNQSKNGSEAIEKFLIEEDANISLLEIGKKGFYAFDFDYNINPLPGVKDMFKEIKAELVLITKGEFIPQIEKLKKAGIDPNIFKKIMAVGDYNKKKYYQQIMQELGFSAKNCFVCGDRYETDLFPAKELGIKTIYIPWGRGKIFPPNKKEVDFIVTNLKEIIPLVNDNFLQDYYKVCILAAGVGTRMEEFTKTSNKVLLSIKEKPVISHIIEKFPENIEIVIAVGYKKETIVDYLKVAFPQRKLTFIEVDKYEGEGTGPGYSLLQCKPYLQCPFIHFAGDTLVTEPVPKPNKNWLGLAPVSNSERFCSAKLENNQVIRLDDKTKNDNKYAYIGLVGINDYKLFWEALEENKNLIGGEIQVSNGLNVLLKEGFVPEMFTWFDTGTPDSYLHALNNFPNGKSYQGE